MSKDEKNQEDKDLEFLSAQHSNIAGPLLDKIVSFSKVNNVAILTRPVTEGVTEQFLKSEENLEKPPSEQKEEIEHINGKPFEIKTKSSPFKPLNSAIPYDPALSKSTEDLSEVQEHTDRALAKYKNDREDLINNKNIGESIEYLYKDKARHNGYEILYLKDEEGNVIKEQGQGQPLFITNHPNIPGRFLKYDPETNDFTGAYTLQDNVKIQNVEIIYAKTLYKDEVLEREMTRVEQRVAILEQQLKNNKPLEQAKIQTRVEIIESTPKIVKTDIDQFANSVVKTLPESYKDLKGKDHEEIVRKMVEEEKTLCDYNTKITTFSNIGLTNGSSEAIAGALSHDLKGMIYHAEETKRPHVFEPETGKFEVILPDGPIVANVKTEQGAVELINYLNKEKGTSIQPNPEWGWVKDQATGEYKIPEVKFPWKEIYKEIKSSPEREDQEKILKAKIEIERLKLYPNVSYDSPLVHKELEARYTDPVELQAQKAALSIVEKEVNAKLSEHMAEKIKAAEKGLNQLCTEFHEKHGKNSILEDKTKEHENSLSEDKENVKPRQQEELRVPVEAAHTSKSVPIGTVDTGKSLRPRAVSSNLNHNRKSVGAPPRQP